MDAAHDAVSAAALPPQTLVFVDLETTGASPAQHRIIEVGMVRVENGVELEQWSTLVDPGVPIPANIEAITGISNDMVRGAPSFAAVAGEAFERLRGAVFVAHNARFDHGFLHHELLRVGLHLNVPVLCTVKLSRRLYPGHVRHNLDAVMQRHGILCHARHRALGDALVLRDLWFDLQARWSPAVLAPAVAQSMLESPKLPAQLPPELVDELPDGPGVYRYFGADDALLYVGRGTSLRARILAQLGASQAGARDALLAREVRRVDWSQTAGELGAMLREAQLIRLCKPLHNRGAERRGAATLRLRADASGRVELSRIEDLEARELAQCFGVFRSEKDALKALIDLARARELCLKVLGLEDGPGSCLGLQVGECRGACVGRESLLSHDMRVRLALSALKIKSWPFAGRIALRERSRDVEEFHVLEHWAYVGSARSEEELQALSARQQQGGATAGRAAAAFDADVYKILVRFFSKHGNFEWHDLRDRTPVHSNRG